MGHTDVVPVDPGGWSRDPFGGELVDGEVWGRGAVDMLNLTASMAVSFRALASGFRPLGDLIFFAVADEESGSTYGVRWMADHARDAIAADYVLTENGGVHYGRAETPWIAVNVAEKGVAWRRLRVRGTAGHGSMPYKSNNALVKAAAVIQRLADYHPAPRLHELWRHHVEILGLGEDLTAQLVDPDRVDDALEAIPSEPLARQLHASCHTTFSTNAASGPMKTNVIPGVVDVDVDVRTLPGEQAADVEEHLRAALGDLYDQVEIELLLDARASFSPADTPLWDSLQRAVSRPFPDARLSPQLMVGFTDARVYREIGAVAYGAGLLSPALNAGEFGRRFHGNDERIDLDSLRLTTDFFTDVTRDFLG
jgi:acetylornithine deacetylase/succinyl-diaminopimelate desuccinylase-like protein